ncbi:MAG: hypothetical protein RMK98_07535, partial [Bacteroidia bacterium]|nr:hypothetical protein [Bacteroidia bacterium]
MSISAIWQQAWEKFKNGNWVIGVVLIVLTVFLSFVPFVGIFFSYLLGVCLSYYGLQVWRSDSPVDFRSVFPPIMAFLKILLGSILLAVIPGLIILISAYDFVMDIIGIARVAQEVSSEPEVHLKGDTFAQSLKPNFL